MANAHVGIEASAAQIVTVRSSRPREYLTEREIERLIEAAGKNRWGHRDATAILIAYRHGLRASELVALRWDDIDFTTGKLHVRRAKGGMASVHPLGGKELRALRRLQRETPEGARTVHVDALPAGRLEAVAHLACFLGRCEGANLSAPGCLLHHAPCAH